MIWKTFSVILKDIIFFNFWFCKFIFLSYTYLFVIGKHSWNRNLPQEKLIFLGGPDLIKSRLVQVRTQVTIKKSVYHKTKTPSKLLISQWLTQFKVCVFQKIECRPKGRWMMQLQTCVIQLPFSYLTLTFMLIVRNNLCVCLSIQSVQIMCIF